MQLRVGDKALDFELPSQRGDRVRLSDFFGKRNVVLYFYPRDRSPVCTVEACAFRDDYEVFKEAGAEVIGVSADSVESHRIFAEAQRLPFILLSDPSRSVRRLYGVAPTLGILPGRVTFVIDKRGIIRHAFSSQFRGAMHAAEALRVLEALNREEPVPSR
jgi:peroxiredoxin Q/BCP